MGDVVIVHKGGPSPQFLEARLHPRPYSWKGATVGVAGKNCCFTSLNRLLQLLRCHTSRELTPTCLNKLSPHTPIALTGSKDQVYIYPTAFKVKLLFCFGALYVC